MNDNTFYAEIETIIFLKSLPINMRKDLLFEYFCTFGKIRSVRFHTDSTDSFGFVQFQDVEAAGNVLKTKYHTIAGRRIEIEMARNLFQDEPTTDHKLSIELAKARFMELNDDCLREILNRLSGMDLCSLMELSSITENVRLKAITNEIFARKYKICSLANYDDPMYILLSMLSPDPAALRWNNDVNVAKAQRLLTNFGSVISELTVSYPGSNPSRLIQTIVERCSATLKSLCLSNLHVAKNEPRATFPKLENLELHECIFEGDAITDVFAHCESLVALTISHNKNPNNRAIFRNTFPELEIFNYIDHFHRGSWDGMSLKMFFSRHKKLKSIVLHGSYDSDPFPAIIDNCSELRTLSVDGCLFKYPNGHILALRSVSSLKNLEELKISSDSDALLSIQRRSHLQSLKVLSLYSIYCTHEIITNLTQLKMLAHLSITNCDGLTNLNPLAELSGLKTLTISSRSRDLTFDLVHMVSRLTELEALQFHINYGFTIGDGVHSRIVDARLSAGSARRSLEIFCNSKKVFPIRVL